MTARKVVIVGSFSESFIDFRGSLAKCLISHGYDVHVLLPDCDPALATSICSLGVTLHHYKIDRTGKNLLADLGTVHSLHNAFKEIMPTHVLSYTIKPVLYSNLALRVGRTRARSFALITGLGFLFTADTARIRLARLFIVPFYRLALRRCEKIIFQNPDDRQLFIDYRLATDANSAMVAGSGVNIDRYSVAPLPDKPVFLMIARLVRDKGINEYFEAARRIRQSWPDVQFKLLGYLDANPTSLTESELQEGIEQSGVTFYGRTEDVRPFIGQASVFVLPSYREGTPRTVLEAMSMGRAIITTDVPGCRETVVNGVNGYLVKPQSASDLATAMQTLLTTPGILPAMGQASREMVCKKFRDDIVNRAIVDSLE